MEFNNKYAVVSLYVFNVIQPQYVQGGTKENARVNLAGTKWILELEPGSPYYNLSFAKTHSEIREIVASPEWSAEDE